MPTGHASDGTPFHYRGRADLTLAESRALLRLADAALAYAARCADPPDWWARLTPVQQTAVQALAETTVLTTEEAATLLTRHGWDYAAARQAVDVAAWNGGQP